MAIPPEDLLEDFNNRVIKLFELARNNKNKIEKLIQLRNMLLLKLMNGEIDVSNVEIDKVLTNKLSFSKTIFVGLGLEIFFLH